MLVGLEYQPSWIQGVVPFPGRRETHDLGVCNLAFAVGVVVANETEVRRERLQKGSHVLAAWIVTVGQQSSRCFVSEKDVDIGELGGSFDVFVGNVSPTVPLSSSRERSYCVGAKFPERPAIRSPSTVAPVLARRWTLSVSGGSSPARSTSMTSKSSLLPAVNRLGVKWFENRRFSSSRESFALSIDPEASRFHDVLCRHTLKVSGVRRERSLHGRVFGPSQP